jgi:hypothetical protein
MIEPSESTELPAAPTNSANPSPGTNSAGSTPTPWPKPFPWLSFVLPLAVYMLVNSLEPSPPDPDKPAFAVLGVVIPYSAYPLVYTIKIALTMIAMAAVWPGYRQFAPRLSPLAPVVGVVGVVLWIGLCKLHLESTLLSPLGLDWLLGTGARSAFNPWEHWPDRPLVAGSFLAVRFWGLAVIVPIIEEFFLRGFVMRFCIEPQWWTVPIGSLTPTAAVVGMLYGVLTHPAEILAAAAWFTLITWLGFKTKNIWDCVIAHAVTNLLLGVYVVTSGDWVLW